ncbi:MAG: APC family permease [Solirubrobacteraceae bacterium]
MDSDTTAAGGPPTGSATGESYEQSRRGTNMRRDIGWLGAFFIAAGVPALVLFSMGGISALTGPVAILVWTLSVLIGFVDAFVFAEIAGLHPRKSGGTAVHGATAWFRYVKPAAPVSLWCNWVAWTPVLAIGSGLGAGYLLSVFFAADAKINTWNVELVNLDFLKSDLTLRINATFLIGAAILLCVWTIQHRGILRTARIQTILTVGSLVPLLIVVVIPLVTGDVVMDNFSPFVPINGAWDHTGWSAFFGALFLAAWSAYAFETTVCYMSEFRNPSRDMSRAILWAGVLCIVCYFLVPFVFQGVLGTKAMLEPGIASGAGVGEALAGMLGGGSAVTKIFVVLLFFTLLLAIMTAMSGSSRTLFQGGEDGLLPKYLARLNAHKVPTAAMWTDLGLNLILLLMSDYIFVLAVSNCNYMIFNFLNLNAGWIHRRDNAHVPRPFKAPLPLFVGGVCFAYFNMFLLGAGADSWGNGTLITGWIVALIAVPIFLYRHYVTDKGRYPAAMFQDLVPPGQASLTATRSGVLPYIAIAGGLAAMFIGYFTFGS